MKIVEIFEQLTNLQIYGAAIDEIPLTIEQMLPSPFSAMESRLEINLYPDASIAPRYGVVPIGFTILSPNEDIAGLAKRCSTRRGGYSSKRCFLICAFWPEFPEWFLEKSRQEIRH